MIGKAAMHIRTILPVDDVASMHVYAILNTGQA